MSLHSKNYSALLVTIRQARLNAGLTQQQVADALGKPQSFVAKVEGGERRLDVSEFIELAAALNCDPSGLFKDYLSRLSD